MTIKTIARNKRASYEYQLLERVEAGIVLQGTEIKSLREGKVNISDAYVSIDNQGEVYINQMSISPYLYGNRANHLEGRRRKLLLHKREITKIKQLLQTKGLTIIPLSIYFKDSLVKLELVLAKGKKIYDKRESERAKEALKSIHLV